ncbi:MAG: M48 family metallopeptidase [Endomicrobia bacterium]|nr:M48 family metallopeptidase [Endomicrobiia bacterium]
MKRIITLLAVLFVIGCTTVPITGRRQLSLVSDSQVSQLSAQEYQQTLQKSTVITTGADVQLVRTVGVQISKAAEAFLRDSGLESEIAGYAWEFNLIKEDQTVNAFCMPGGKIVVYTGILPYTKDATGLAVVLGHEVAHAIAKHGAERMSQEMIAQGAGTLTSILVSNKSEQTQQLVMTAYGLGSQYGVLLPYSRKHELEADRIGLILMARAGYDPNKAVAFWQRMSAGGSSTPEFMSTHPSDATRINDLQKYIPEAMQYYKK